MDNKTSIGELARQEAERSIGRALVDINKNIKTKRLIEEQEEREMSLEREALRLVTLNKTDTIKSEKGIELKASIPRCVNGFYKQLSDKELSLLMTMTSVDNEVTVEVFKNYATDRSNKKQNQKYEEAFTCKEFRQDIKNQLKIKVMEFKHKEGLFLDSRLGQDYARNEINKINRSLMHETRSRADNRLIKEILEISDKRDEGFEEDVKQLIESRGIDFMELEQQETLAIEEAQNS